MTKPSQRKGLSARKLARLEALLAEEGLVLEAAGIPRRPSGETPPLSVGEEQLWFLAQLAPDDPAYNMPFALRLRGALDPAALRTGLASLAARHEALRTVYPDVDGRPVKVEISAPPALPLVDLRGLPLSAAESEADRLASEEGARPFDLARGPLVRALLLAVAPGDHRLLLNLHHILADGGSMAVLFRELPAIYRGAALPEPSLQYGDFAHWQRGWLTGGEAAELRAWWRERLSGLAPQELPADRPASMVPSGSGTFVPVAVDAGCAAALRRLGQEEGATLFMVLLATFQTLLHRRSGQADVAVGSPVSGRGRPELQDLFGFLVNMVVLRTDLGGDPTFRELLGRARETALGAFAHGELPFETLVEELHPERRLSRNPLFRAALVLQDPAAGAVEEGGLAWDLSEVLTGTAKFDLELELREGPDGLSGRLWYARDLFDAPAVERMAGHLGELLAGIVEDPDRRLSELPLLTAAEQRQIAEWAGTRTAYPRERGIHELFAEQAARRPEATALVFGGERISYRELDERADRIARRLAALGIGAESRVGLFAERSPEMVAGTLGILKAGAAYVPLDVQYPRERLVWMLEDADLAAVLTQGRLAGLLPASAPLLLLDGSLGEEATEEAGPWAGPDSAAYLMYTSGSTGRPKGVVVTHRNVVRLVRETAFARFGESEVFLQCAPVSFDAATLEIWGPLLNGGTLVICDPHALSLHELGRVIEKERVTTLWLTAGLFHQMVDERLESLAGVRQLLAGGDVLSPAHVGRALSGLPGCRLINGYGPTENTTFTCCHPIEEGGGEAIPIGRPIANTWVHVLDRSLRPVPAGVPGELCAGGDGLARGYFRRPDVTAERFIPDPLSTEPGARLYRTGDLVRRRSDGVVEFLGRIDNQVKIRGFRVEPGEVEQALGLHPEVASCAVAVREDRPGDRQLVAYVVPVEEAEPATGDLRAFLERALPAPMIPSAFVRLDALPLTPNGKVDRRALPAPATGEEEGELVAPRTPAEEILAGIWREVLGVERVDVRDDFFALGGHSLKMMQVASRLRDAFGLELPLRTLFEAVTVADLAERVERERGEIGGDRLQRAQRPDPLPLSSAQRRLWFLDQLEPGKPTYNIPLALHLRGPLDASAIEGALGEIVRRHEVLRTTFPSRNGEVVQAIGEPVPPGLPRVDLAALPEPCRRAEAERLAMAEARAPFDLARGPVLRLLLLRLGAEEHELVLVLHHIVADGWSVRVLFRELVDLYAAAREGRTALLPELAVQYADYAVWQNEELRGEALDRQLAFWRARLADVPALDLATDRPRPPVQSQRGADRARLVPARLAASLHDLARGEGATLFMTLLASLQALLHRHTGQEDFALGTPVANRGRSELEGLIGFFANTLVLRSSVDGSLTFRRLLAVARDEVIGAQEHRDVPFERLVEELQPERDLGRSPLFQVMLTVETESEPPRLPGLTAAVRTLDTGTAKFDLGFTFLESAGEARIAIEYAADLFDAPTVDRLLERWLTLLDGAAADPAAAVAELPLLSAGERHQLLEWSQTGRESAGEGSLHGLLESQAERTPDATALVCEGEVLSYAELHRRADRLARRLRRLGARPEERVGILLRRSADLVVGLLGILKSGAAYVPLDPAYPERRLALMLEDADPAVVIAESRLLGLLPEGRFATLCLDEESEALEREGGGGPSTQVASENLAYLIYTSGSTGRPKGVAITHGSAVALLRWARGLFPPESLAGVLAGTSVCFDLSVFEIFVPLAWGGRVFLAENALALASLPQAAEVTLVNTVPSAMAELVRLGALPASVDTVNLAGEALHNALVQQVYGRGVRRVYNLYGPSEDTTYSTCRLLAEEDTRAPSIGRPLPGTRAFVLDARLAPVPLGSPGELFLGGAGLARGYLHRPDLTAERFVPDPWSGEPGARLYRTGDLVRHLPDGELLFLGRIDHQVKVRGYRIELGEIEAALLEHPSVEQAVVVARQEPGGPALVAYIAPAPAVPAPDALRRFLQQRLPEFMVPAVFVGLEALPLTPNGKVDRKALPAPEPSSWPATAAEAPRTPMEEILAGIWAEVLGRERIGPRDDFFELGGHSLKAAQVFSRARESLRVDLPVRALFEASTLAGLAARVESELQEGSGQAGERPPIVRIPRDGGVPLSFAQQRLWFLDQIDPGNVTYNVPALVEWTGPLEIDALRRAVDAVVDRHEILRTTFRAEGAEPVQVIGSSPRPSLQVVDLGARGTAARQEAERLARELAREPFALSRGPLLRAVLFELGDPAGREHLLFIALHHIVADWWSLGILLREIGALYQAFARGEANPLPDLPVQYADFAVWQRQWLQEGVLDSQLAYWRGELERVPDLDLPTDRPRPAVRRPEGASLSFSLPSALAAEAGALGRRRGATRFMVVLAALQALLYRYTGQPLFAVGTPVAHRELPAIEGLIGFFLNTLALRADLSGEPSFAELLLRVRTITLGAFAHQDIPFERLVEELAPRRDLSRTPLFQVMLTFQNDAAALALPEATLSLQGVELGAVKFDLILALGESGSGIIGSLHYSTQLFDSPRMVRLVSHFETLLAGALAAADVSISELPLLSAAELHQVLVAWNGAAAPEAGAVTLSRRLEMQAGLRPGAAAVVCGTEVVSYAELERRANRLSRYLAGLGIGRESRVGMLLDRSLDLVVAIHAAWKAAAAYVPLDPAYPLDRLVYQWQDSGVELIVTRQSLLAGMPEDRPRTVCLDLAAPEIALFPDDAPAAQPDLDDLAYVIYTSGSTGRPKGVAVSHRGLGNLAEAQTRDFRLGPEDRILQFASPNFDASVSEMAMALWAGAALHLAPQDRMIPGKPLLDLLREQAITNVTLPPTALAALPVQDLPALQSLVLAGEACPPALADRWSGGRRIYNAYGPTETTVCATQGEHLGSGPMSLGRPIAGLRVYLLDPRMRPVPTGTPGEVCIGGCSLARGYLNRPDLTAERFQPDPFAAEPGARLYRTGDLARHLPDGRLEFLGRIDRQVKVRGFRIELGEIEAALARHPELREAAVLALPDPADPNGRRLVAYVVTRGPARPGVADLRRFLGQSLPEYMMPAAVVHLEALPLTPNGKVDRKALPEPDRGRAGLDPAYVALADEVERFVADLWQEVLGLERIGARDNFFEAGGNSIKAALLINRLQEKLGEYVYVVALFDAPTVSELAVYLQRNYPAALARITGRSPESETGGETLSRVDADMVLRLREIIEPLPPRRSRSKRNRRAVFLLSPPRSGSTLLRVMLAGNPRLFAPPELELLGFNTLRDRREAFTGRYAFWAEGTVRALMEACGLDTEAAQRRMADCEERDLTVPELYAELQRWIGDRLLVDKTPSYSLDARVLERAEADFDEPLYIHLLRHPCGMIASFVKAKLEQVFFRMPHSFSRRQLAELIWVASHENILGFLGRVPAERQMRLRFEDLVRQPREVLDGVCRFLGIELHPDMLDPYKDKARRMTDGIHALSKMLGDVKFHEHSKVDPRVAESWKEEHEEGSLGDVTLRLAGSLGYGPRARSARSSVLVPEAASGPSGDIAIVGMSGRFPGANDLEAFWRNLRDGVESISFFGAAGPPEVIEHPRYVAARGIVEGADLFDAPFFGLRPREAELLDPQHRLFLECCWEALESAGYEPERFPGAVGVWAGVGKSLYYLHNIHPGEGAGGDPEAEFGNDRDFLPTRVSYKLNLRGPSLAVQTACSSSLATIHLACASLLQRECDMALAGGVRIAVPQELGYFWQEGGIASPDGHCRAFDARAQGVVPGNGVGVVLLKRLDDALADGDSVLAVIKGSAINNDGSRKVGYTAPAVEGQAQVIARAQAVAGVSPDTIGYVEAHGTGTALGDPIEVAALTRAFQEGTRRRGFCAIGSVKSNLGHLDAAAGVASVIKTALALRHGLIPPSLHFERPNPELRLEESPFYVNAALREWPANGAPRRAGVSSFGIGGTNVHLILEEAPEVSPSGPSRPAQVLTVSARTPAALERACRRLAAHLRASPGLDLADVAYTLQVGRRAFDHRRSAACTTLAEAAEALEGTAARTAVQPGASVAFLFPGQGSQHPGMAAGLYAREAVFRREIDRCAELLREPLGLDLRTVLFPADGAAPRLERTELAQPALFAVEHALARLWMSWGIEPQALIGHSVGEYVAACLAGVFSLEDALALVAERGRLMGSLPPGGMLSVPLDEESARAELCDGLALAAVNGPSACVVAGEMDVVEALRLRLEERGVECRRLRVSHAFHSSMMDPVLERFAAAVERCERRPPRLPWLSNLTGTWIRAEEAMDPGYWVRHLRETVRFQDGLEILLREPGRILLEVGPGATLSTLARRHPEGRGRTIVHSLPRPDEDVPDEFALCRALGSLWTAGVEPRWEAFHAGEARRRVPLPTYPFERQRYWIEPPASPWQTGSVRESAAPEADEMAAQHARPQLETGYAAPRDEIESSLAEIWQGLFGIARVGIHDDFYELGGDSLLATRLAARIRDHFRIEIPMSSLLQAGSVAGQAELCRAVQPAQTDVAAEIGDLLEAVSRLSAEELEAMLAQESASMQWKTGGTTT